MEAKLGFTIPLSVFFACLLAGCSSISELRCSIDAECLSTENGFIVGGSKAERVRAVRELDLAAANFRIWTGHSAPFGAISLRNGLDLPWLERVRIKWFLNFDPVETGRVERGLQQTLKDAGSHAQPVANRPVSYDSGDLSHEICHRYVDWLTVRAGAHKSVPDMINEAAAISCEPETARARRFQAARPGDKRAIDAAEIDSRHNPLSVSPEVVKASGVAGSMQRPKTITFVIEPGTTLSENVADFYYRSAELQQFLRSRSCVGRSGIGSLIASATMGQSYKKWWRDREGEACLK